MMMYFWQYILSLVAIVNLIAGRMLGRMRLQARNDNSTRILHDSIAAA